MYPTPTQGRKRKAIKSVHVLTSIESRTLLEEKERKKREEISAKEQRRQDRLAQKTDEQKQKQQARAAKADERQKKAEMKALKGGGGTGRKRKARESC